MLKIYTIINNKKRKITPNLKKNKQFLPGGIRRTPFEAGCVLLRKLTSGLTIG
jgi:hypothetical protein